MENDILNFLTTALGSFQPSFTVKLVSFVISLAGAIVVTILILKIRKLLSLPFLAQPLPSDDLPKVKEVGVVARWSEIKRHVQSQNEAEWKLAIIEADKLINDILHEIGVSGDTLGEKLTNINSAQLASINDLWEGHKVRNKIAHDSGFFIRDVEARRVIGLFEKSLRELEAI